MEKEDNSSRAALTNEQTLDSSGGRLVYQTKTRMDCRLLAEVLYYISYLSPWWMMVTNNISTYRTFHMEHLHNIPTPIDKNEKAPFQHQPNQRTPWYAYPSFKSHHPSTIWLTLLIKKMFIKFRMVCFGWCASETLIFCTQTEESDTFHQQGSYQNSNRHRMEKEADSFIIHLLILCHIQITMEGLSPVTV